MQHTPQPEEEKWAIWTNPVTGERGAGTWPDLKAELASRPTTQRAKIIHSLRWSLYQPTNHPLHRALQETKRGDASEYPNQN